MPGFRPRISLLSALLLLAVAGMAIVIVQLWREVGPQRQELRQLRNEVGYLTIDDPKRFHAIEVLTNKDWSWKWRIWVPEGETVAARMSLGDVPRDGFPDHDRSINLEPGEHWITLELHQDPIAGKWTYVFATPVARTRNFDISVDQAWMAWVQYQAQSEGVGYESVILPQHDARHLLMRYRATRQSDPHPTVIDAPIAGFIIWVERR